MGRTAKIVVLMAFVAAALVVVSTTASSADIPKAINWESVQDDFAREAARIINEKLLLANEIKCTMEIGEYASGKFGGKREESLSARRTGEIFSKGVYVESANPTMKGMVSHTIIDGKTYWNHMQSAPGSGKALVESMRKLGMKQADIQKAIKQHREPKVIKFDLTKLNDAGFPIAWALNFTNPLTPFVHCDVATLKIENEEADSWIFSAKPYPAGPFQAATTDFIVGIYKDSGVLKYAEYGVAGGLIKQAVKDVTLAPNPPLADSLFTFKVPDGLTALDQTDIMLQALRKL